MAMQPVRRIAGQIVQMAPVAALSGLGFSDLAAGAAPSDELDPIPPAEPFDPAQEALMAFGSGSASPLANLADDDLPDITGGACAVAPPPPPVAPPAPLPVPKPQVVVVRQMVQQDPVVRTIIERQPVVHQTTHTTVVDDRDTTISQTIVQTITAGGDVSIDTDLGVASGDGAVVGIGNTTGGMAPGAAPATGAAPDPEIEGGGPALPDPGPAPEIEGGEPALPGPDTDTDFGTGAGPGTPGDLAPIPELEPEIMIEAYPEPGQDPNDPLHAVDLQPAVAEEYHEPGQGPDDPQFHVSDLGDDVAIDDQPEPEPTY